MRHWYAYFSTNRIRSTWCSYHNRVKRKELCAAQESASRSTMELRNANVVIDEKKRKYQKALKELKDAHAVLTRENSQLSQKYDDAVSAKDQSIQLKKQLMHTKERLTIMTREADERLGEIARAHEIEMAGIHSKYQIELEHVKAEMLAQQRLKREEESALGKEYEKNMERLSEELKLEREENADLLQVG